MSRTERFYRIEMLIKSRGGVRFDTLLDELEVSPATLKRDLQYLRDRMDAPIVYDRLDNVYRFEAGAGGQASSHELPGIWFSQSEIHALLTMHQLVAGLDAGGVLGRHLQPLLDKLDGLLVASEGESRELMKRVRIASPARRPVPSRWFETVGSALLQRRRVDLLYFTRVRQQESRREVSPQRLIHYRNTWYLDAWCHASEGLRRFALDAVRSARLLETRAKDVPMKTVQAELDGGYGIFSGKALQQATLRFSAEAAQWVRDEQWHPDQQIKDLPDGGLEMRLPYADATELVMDILRHGPQVQVLAPAALARQVAAQVQATLALYR